MSVKIDKSDLRDISISTAERLFNYLTEDGMRKARIAEIIEEELADWIDAVEQHELDYKREQIENMTGTGEMMDRDY